MADALVTITVEGILKKLFSIAAEEFQLARNYKEKLSNLHRSLDMIRAKLRDADRQKGTEAAVMVWLKQLKDVVEEADDVLDEVHYEMLRREVKARNRVMSRKVLSLPSLKKFTFRREMGHKIDSITKKLSVINKEANDLGLQNEQPVSRVQDSLYRDTDSFLDEFKIVGRENDEVRVIKLLTESVIEEKLKIVPIVGMGGIGKTTLAKSVYNHLKIEKFFDVKYWLCVSVKVDLNTLLAKICESIARVAPMSQTRVNLISDLVNKLGSKRYLIVLDDVWDEERAYWDDVRSCMLKINSQNGSAILVTTRKLEIGTNDMTKDSCPLKCLSDDESWSMFKERAFVTGQPPSLEFAEIGRDIVKKCRGLPLLVNVIGGTLRNYDDKEKWLSMKDSNVWDLEVEGDRVLKTLKLSFDYLPNSAVQQCFAYCSIFTKDTQIEKEVLIQLWIALGLVQADETGNKEMEDVGNDIFQILVTNSLLRSFKWPGFDDKIGFEMHDLVHDLSVSLSKHESLCLVDPKGDDMACIPDQIKHLSVYSDYQGYYEFETKVSMVFQKDTTAKSLQTFFFRGEVEKGITFHRFKSVRILIFNKCKLDTIDDSIGDLVHLRYLDLSDTEISVLPKSIGKLYHLQTLKLFCCDELEELPDDMKNLHSLRDFGYDESIPPHILVHLISLRTLPIFTVDRENGCQLDVLRNLKHLRGELHIFNLDQVRNKEDAAKADLFGKKNLSKIIFSWNTNKRANPNGKDVLEGLQPHRNVKILEIVGFSGDFPVWVTRMAIHDVEGKWLPLDKLMRFKLIECHSCVSLPMVLEHLPLLRDLSLSFMDNLRFLRSFLGQCEHATGSMKKPLSLSLKSLELMHLESLEGWIDVAPNNLMMVSPVLDSLYIGDCPRLILLDECHPHPLVSLEIRRCENLESISIHGLTSLESLKIHSCPSLVGLPDFHNQHHSLKSLTIRYCDKLTSLPRDMFDCFAILHELKLGPFSMELDHFPSLQGIEKLRNHLQSLKLCGWDHWDSIPEEIKHLTSLTRLNIRGFGMRELPSWLTNMSSIRHIKFSFCKGLNRDIIKRGAPHNAHNVFLNRWDIF